MIVFPELAITTVLALTKLEGLNVNALQVSLGQDVRETSTNAYQIHVRDQAHWIAYNLSTIITAIVKTVTWADTVKSK